MNMRFDISFEPQTNESPVVPLSRFLPSCPPGMIEGWLAGNVQSGSWILDPFGSTPLVALQAARAGYKVLVAANNPLLAFEIQILSMAKNPLDFQTALADLASTRRGDQRIELQIQSLYMTHCASCGKEIQASGFLWKKGESTPHARIYTCPYCGDEGVHPITEADLNRLRPLQRAEPLHRARAIEKVLAAEADNDLKENIKEALQVYPVRPLVVIFTLLNKLESLLLSDEKRRNLQALVISVLDAGTSLWPWPQTKDTPRLMSSPAEFIEKNLWLELENAVSNWSQPSTPIDCTTWPILPQKAGICIFPGRMKNLYEANQSINPKAVVCVFPRPNQSFWTLSALWSAWIWGKEHASHYVNVLNRRRYDWLWHSRALQSALSSASKSVSDGTIFFGLLPEAVPGLVLSSCTAASSAGLDPAGIACKPDSQIVQILWKTSSLGAPRASVNVQNVAREAIRKNLTDYGQPAPILPPYTSAIVDLASLKALPLSVDQITADELSELQISLQKIFFDRSFICHYDSTAQDLDVGTWGLVNFTNALVPLDDRVENEISQILNQNQKITFSDLQKMIFRKFPGTLTPSDELFLNILRSYAEYDPKDSYWHLRQSEDASTRNNDLKEISETLHLIGKKLGFTQHGDQPIIWNHTPEEKEYRFFIGATGNIQHCVETDESERVHFVYVFPGSRAALLNYKIEHNPQLKQNLSKAWHFVKFRYLRELSQREDLTPELWSFLLDGDPISPEKDTQLRIVF